MNRPASLLIVIGITVAQALCYSGGSGTSDDPYQIAVAQDLIDLGNSPDDYDKHFTLTSNIDLSAYTFETAVIAADTDLSMGGFQGREFSGVLDGGGHIISNLTIDDGGIGNHYLGLFGCVSSHNTAIKNLGMKNISIAGADSSEYLGGLCGDNNCDITSCFTTGDVSGGNYLGGLCGRNSAGLISDCYSTTDIAGTKYLGGLCGHNSLGLLIRNCYSTGSVTGEKYLGGLCGYSGGRNRNCFWDIETSGQLKGPGAIGLLTVEMTDPIVYGLGGWAKNQNWILDGEKDYPRLAWEQTDGQVIPDPGMDWIHGAGTADEPYEVADLYQLSIISKTGILQDKHFCLSADIDCSGSDMLPIGYYLDEAFTGVFDGNDYKIDNLTINLPEGVHVGLFSNLGGDGIIKNLKMEHVNLIGSRYVGALAGKNSGTILDSMSTGSTKGEAYAGGLCGLNDGQIRNCFSMCNVAGDGSLGGLCGENEWYIISCYSTGDVTGTAGSGYLGGLVGWNNRGFLEDCYAEGAVNGEDTLGGLCGDNYFGVISDCYAEGPVNGEDHLGGLVGVNGEGRIRSCFAKGAVNGEYRLGGLVGMNDGGSVENCYAKGPISGDSYFGGLVGGHYGGGIINCYSTGQLSGEIDSEFIGGFVGEEYQGSIINCFWDIETSGQSTSRGGIGLLTANMMNPLFYGFNGWANDPNWILDPGKDYPHLVWEKTVGQMIPVPSMDWIPGSGTPDDPYRIGDVYQLGIIGKAHLVHDKHFCLSADIDLAGLVTMPIGYYWEEAFTGVFDGNDHKISNLTMTLSDTTCTGLFSCLGTRAIVKNLIVEDVNIASEGDYVGALAGWNAGTIINCSATGRIAGKSNVGVVCGHNDCGLITFCTASGSVSGGDLLGGLCGYNESGLILNSSSAGEVTGETYSDYLGGLVGKNDRGTIKSCYSTSNVISGTQSSYLGGLVGNNKGSIKNCHAEGSVKGEEFIGGLVGSNASGSNISNCYSTGSVTGNSRLGGFCGYNGTAIISNCFHLNTAGPDNGLGIPLPDAAMKQQHSYTGWLFLDPTTNLTHEVWIMPKDGSGYPVLSALYTAGYSGGRGDPNDPFRIATALDMMELSFSREDWDKHFTMVGDIDLSTYSFEMAPIAPDMDQSKRGFDGTAFTGVFNGNGHKITHLRIDDNGLGNDYLGLFGMVSGTQAQIRNLGLEHVSITGGDRSTYLGSLCGKLGDLNEHGVIRNCYSTGSVTGGTYSMNVAGLCGSSGYGCIVSGCYSMCSVNGGIESECLAGLCAINYGHIDHCYASGSVMGGYDVGGFVGQYIGGSVTFCYSNGQVMGEDCGGLIGYNRSGDFGQPIKDCFWDTEASGQSYSDGGIGLLTYEMMDPLLFSLNGWDNDPNWVLDAYADYPHLVWEQTPGQTIPDPRMDWIHGSGTAEDPFDVSSFYQLSIISKTSLFQGMHFYLSTDIDYAGLTIYPIDHYWEGPFFGVFDGNGFKIHNLTVNQPDGRHVGLFRHLGRNGVIKDLAIADVNVSGYEWVGGLVGKNDGGLVINSSSIGTVTGQTCVGGLIGLNGPYWNQGAESTVIGCFAAGHVIGEEYVGGLIGENFSTVSQSYAAGVVTGNQDSNCVGGLVGRHFAGDIGNCYATGAVTGNTAVGGLVGSNILEYDRGVVYGDISRCYATALVSGKADVGGLVGVGGAHAVESSFWNIKTSACTDSVGGLGLSSEEMLGPNMFVAAQWDFDRPIWTMQSKEYPKLVWDEPECREGTLADHAFEIHIDAGHDYEDPGIETDTEYEFCLEIQTDACVERIIFTVPSGESFEIPMIHELEMEYQDGQIGTSCEYNASDCAWEWSYEATVYTPEAATAYGDGMYRITFHFEDGREETTTVWFGEPDSNTPLSVPNRPMLTTQSYTDGTLALQWSPYTISCLDTQCSTFISFENESAGREIEFKVDGATTEYLAPLIPGQWDMSLTYYTGYESHNSDGVRVLCGKWSESDYELPIE